MSFLGVLLTSCSAGTGPAEVSDADAAAVGIDLNAELRPDSGQVILPYDRFLPTVYEEDALHDAAALVQRLCLRENGADVVAMRHVEQPIYNSEHFYGPWTMAQAERFAFVTPMPDADLRGNQIIPEGAGEPSVYEGRRELNSEIPQEEIDRASSECGGAEEARTAGEGDWLFDYATPWQEEINAIDSAVEDDETKRELLEELGACFERNGMSPHPTFEGAPEGARIDTIDEEQIELAVRTVKCKEEIRFTERMADLLAAYQAPILVEYEREIVAQGDWLQEKVKEAEVFMGEHPEAFAAP